MAASMTQRLVGLLLLLAVVLPSPWALAEDSSCPLSQPADAILDEVSLLQYRADLASDKAQFTALLEALARREKVQDLPQDQPVEASARNATAPGVALLSAKILPANLEGMRDAAKTAAASACASNENLVFIGILSAPDNLHRRNLARDAFLDDFQKAGFDPCIRMKFVIGHAEFTTAHQGQVATPEQMAREQELEEERRQYGDILRVTVPESYKTLPDKVLSILSNSLLENYKFVAKVDDDCVPDLPMMLSLITSVDPDSFLYAGRYLWDRQAYPFQVGADGKFAPYYSGPTYLLSRGLARQIVIQDAEETNEFVSYGSKSEDMDMGKWVQLAEKLSGKPVRWESMHLSFDLCAGSCEMAGYTKS